MTIRKCIFGHNSSPYFLFLDSYKKEVSPFRTNLYNYSKETLCSYYRLGRRYSFERYQNFYLAVIFSLFNADQKIESVVSTVLLMPENFQVHIYITLSQLPNAYLS